jgi:amino acid adenylation domain-containing protein/thioester reductase-like protein
MGYDLVEELVAPASYAQERLWLDCQMEPDLPIHNLLAILELDGDLSPEDVTALLAIVVERHEALRTALELRDERLVQVVYSPVPPARLPVTDLSGMDTDRQQQRFDEVAAAERAALFTLDRPPLWRARLVRTDDRWRLLFAAHHIVYDGGSGQVLLAELTELAAARRERRDPHLPELEIQYADFAAWQRDLIDGDTGRAQLAHWHARLATAPAVHALPLDHPRPQDLAHPGDDVFFTLPEGLLGGVEALGQRHGATEMMVLLAAYVALVAEQSGQPDVVIGVPSMGRERAELRALIGMFVNTLVVRVDAGGDPTFEELVIRVRDRLFEAWEHQDVPFQVLVSELAPARVPGVRPLFQLGFNHLKTIHRGTCHGIARDELLLVLGGRSARFEYRTDLFTRATVERFARRYTELLTDAQARPQSRLSALANSLVTPAADAVPAPGAAAGAATGAATVAAAGLPRYPLSFSQERLWVLEQLVPGDPVYNMPLAARLRGELDIPAFRRALAALVSRHAILRTTFTELDGEPVQLVAPAAAVPLPVEDLSGVAEADRLTVAREVAAAEARVPFDLSSGPLLRVKLLRLGPQDHFLLLALHHIVGDGWSIGLIIGELSTLYGAYRAGEDEPDLPELQLSYGEFAAWQRAQLTGDELDRQLSYWREHLAGAPTLLELPTERPRAAVETFDGERHAFTLPRDLAEGLRRRCRESDVTPFMAMLAALQVLLARYSNQPDVVVGTPVAGRSHPELDPVVGLFVNTLALRGRLTGDPTLRQVLDQARETTLNGLSNQDVPFEKLVEELQPERSLSHSPVFQVQLIVQNAPSSPLELPGLTVTGEGQHSRTAKFDLTLEVNTAGKEIRMWLEYNTALFSRHWATRFAACLMSVIRAVVEDPQMSAYDVDLLPAAERAEVVTTPNRTNALVPSDCVVDELVTVLSGDGTAIVADGVPTVASQVGDRAARLATVLAAHGVTPDARVGLCLERSAVMVASMLGVWRAGGAYVPLDPAFPRERLRMMVDDSGLNVIVTDTTQRWLADQLAGDCVTVVEVDSAEVAAAPPQPRPVALHGDMLAYVIYTSGSTGRPKGVQVPHRPLANLLYAFRGLLGLGPSDTWVAVTTLSFDIAVLELLLPLLAGSRLVIATREQSAEPRALRRLLDDAGATVLQATPATWQMLTISGGVSAGVRTRLCGGEALPLALAAELAEPGAALWNVYGPTETTVWSAAGTVPSAPESIEVGPPIANTALYVLDRRLLPVPLGVAGELFIGGYGLARGYHDRPGLTADRFVPDPFAAGAGARMYRTGDLVRRLPSGHLEFLGRMDNQVKVRGFRIETGEIEAVLSAHPAVLQAVVTADTSAGETRLVAYLVPATTGAAPADLWSQLRPHLRDQLPDYMLPASLVVLERLPLTPNGKVDRRALPAPSWGEKSDVVYQPPRTEVEQRLADIWAELLRTSEPVGINHDFFSLGGHSLAATRMLARIRTLFGAQLSLREIFAGPTVAEIATAVVAHPDYGQLPPAPRGATGPAATGAPSLPAAAPAAGGDLASMSDQDIEQLLQAALRERAARTAPVGPQQYPLSPLQRRLWFLHELAPDQPTYTVHGVFALSGAVDEAALRDAVAALVARHAALRTTFTQTDGDPVQVVAARAEADVAVVDLAHEAAGRVVALANDTLAEAVREPFDLATGPLLRVRLVRMRPDVHLVLLHLHHLVADHQSLSILRRELQQLYREHSGGEPAALPALTEQYATYAEAASAPAEQQRQREQLDYWRRRLADAPAVLELPTDRPRPPVQTTRGGSYLSSLTAGLTTAVMQAARRCATTPLPLLLSAFHVLLARYSGQSDVVVGTPVTLRPTESMAQVVGLFVNTVVTRADLSGNPTLGGTVDAVQRDWLEALGHAEVPFDRVAEALQPQRSAAYPPVFQVMFVLNDDEEQSLAGSGSGSDELLEQVDVHLPAARFDVTLSLWRYRGRYAVKFDYNVDLFDEATIARMARHYGAVLETMVAEPDRRVWELPLADPSEQVELAAGRRRDRDYPPTLVIDRVAAAAVAAAYPPTPLSATDRLTYGQLCRRAFALAHHLRSEGVGPEQRVGLMLPAGSDALVGLLGILYAGGAYVPLDPGHPADRLRWLLDDSGAEVTVTTAGFAGRLAGHPGRVVLLEEAPAGEPDEAGATVAAPAPGPHERNTAYVIYTSGSTGTPKGVAIEHAALRNLTEAFVEIHGFGPGDRLLMLPPLSFDASVGDVFPALAAGAALVLHPEPAGLAGKDLVRFCAEQQVTVVDAPSVLWQQWVEDLAAGSVPTGHTLEQVMVGGEAVPTEKLRAWARATGGTVRLVNHYGPTETTVCATTYTSVDAAEVAGRTYLPIGTPLPNLRCYVVDAQGGLAPDGVAGELYVGGVAVARGYHGRPGLTAHRFVPDPFSGEEGARLYRTGDRARWHAGALEFLGRTDSQIKIRGHRVELGEVEAAVAAHPQVREVTVVARPAADDPTGQPRLVAYVVGQPTGELDIADLRARLRDRLPDYLRPAHLVPMQALPVTAHGKVDRAALPEPVTDPQAAFDPPRTSTERALADLWAEVLGVGRPIGRDDGFFDLGGHSLLVPRLVGRIRDAIGVAVPVREIFQAPSLAALADAVDGHATAARAGHGPPASTPDLRAEATLPDDVCSRLSPATSRDPREVLLTGATGFLGAYLLDDLLRHTTARVHCLVRAASPEAGAERIVRNLRRYELWRPEYADRLLPMPGDLSAPRLGLSGAQFDQLAAELDLIFHNGGVVNFLQPYEQLKPANVTGTVEVLRLAGDRRTTPVHFVSTLGVFLSDRFRSSGQVSEADVPDDPDGMRSAYNQSKWVADALVRQAADRGLPVTIHRPARITGDSRTGVSNIDDYFSRMLKTYVQLGSVPLWESETDMSPVDHVSATIGHISRQAEAYGSGYHYYNNATISFDEIAVSLRRAGYRVRRLPYPDWRADLLARVDQGEDIALGAFAPLLPAEEPPNTEPEFDCARSERFAVGAGASCPPADATLLQRYLHYFVRSGFFPAPDVAASRPGASPTAGQR